MKTSPIMERFIACTSFAASMKYGKADVAWAFLHEFEFRRTGRYRDAPLRAVRPMSIREA